MTLRLIETFVDKCEDTAMIATQFVPAMMDPVLGDYARNVPDARCACLASSWTCLRVVAGYREFKGQRSWLV